MRSQFLAIAGSIAISVCIVPKAGAQTPQIPFLPNLQLPNTSSSNDSDNRTISAAWVYLDGRRVFQITGTKANLTERWEHVQVTLDQISQDYLDSNAKEVKVQTRTSNELPVIYVNNQYLMTVNADDAKLRHVDTSVAAKQITEALQEDLKRTRQERQTSSLIYHGKIAGGTLLLMIVLSWGFYELQQRSKWDSRQLMQRNSATDQPLTTKLRKQQADHLQEAKRRLFQLGQTAIWGGGTYTILGLFPYTRALQLGIYFSLQFPLKIGIVAIGTYVAVRFSYALIERFTAAIVIGGALLTRESTERLKLRVSTISVVTKGIVTITWVAVSFLVALVWLGINILPLLAGVSLVGVAVSLASQNLIKDGINGFLIILEDQYALGDMISVGQVGGLVENLNWRMTQVRDAEGRLITIPNSEIKIVANLSSRWSRADLNIPVANQTDIDVALKLIESVGLEMDRDPHWQEQILETPRVLGVDNFSERGLIIRVWIKTLPLKQWDVARDYRRRLKVAFDEAGICIP
ncbi:MAG: mechanosensitive ion channel family protein [Rhizonema sp. PD38]|nr:mechanosensitive ion channel family protein [Rhizonema sp. PD38]